jgi:predicted Zn-dependent protease
VKRALVGLAVLAACADPTLPNRQDRYAFDDGFGEVFRWPQGSLPVRIYADDRGPMRALVSRGVAVWEAQFLYGEWRAVLVTDSNAADVVIRWSGAVPADVPPDTAGIGVNACSGLTQIVIDSASNAVERPIRVTASELGSFSPELVIACYVRVVTHELGHTLGLLQHSAQTFDLMAAQPAVYRPSARDRATVEVLYHTAPTIGAPPR